uniref:Integrase catalytic domain-containing protein n=1 Tax=Fagus sylvatica TaxID=28930 RepID=A0A2N9GZ66_FAGSY
MTRLGREGLLGALAKVNLPTCEHSLAGKSTRKPFGKDDFTRYGHVYLVSHKSEALDCFRRFMNLVENQMERTIKTLRTDRGREYLFEQFRELFENKGICRQLTIPGTSQQNGVAERKNRTLLDMVRVPSKSVPSTPYELWSSKKLDLSNLRPWGCVVYVHNATHKHGKLGEHLVGGVTEILSRDVEFMENDFPSKGDVGQSLELYKMVESWDDTPTTNPGDSGREITPSGRESFISAAQDDMEPRSYDEAMSSLACNEWMTAMKEEMESMRTNQVDGSIDKYKARLMAKGYTQREGVDHEETFSPVVRFASIRLILAMVASLDLELHQMDVKTAFLNGELDEEIFMDQPIGFVVKGQEHKEIISNGFLMIEEDRCVYVKRSEGSFIILSLYVDDILLSGNNKEFIKTIKEWLSLTFEMKDMGKASFMLGVKILRDRSRKLLGDSLNSEMCPKTQAKIESMARVPYANAIGSLMYAMLCTRSDICFVVRLVSRFQSNPGPAHWKVVKRILRYLRETADYMLCYHGRDLCLRGYSDADWAGDLDGHKSISACLEAVQEVVWLSRFLQCLDVVASVMDLVTIYSDSMAALTNPREVGCEFSQTLKESGLMKISSQALGVTRLRSVWWKYQDAFMTYALLGMEEKSTATCDHTTCAHNDHQIGSHGLFGFKGYDRESAELKLSGTRAKGRPFDNTSKSDTCVWNSC